MPQQVYLMADSSVIRTQKPFFIPHFANSFLATSAIVLHIDRLGRHIAPRFAQRYCHAIAPALKITATGIEASQESEQHSALAHSFDGALLLGDSTAIATEQDINQAVVSSLVGNQELEVASLASIGLDYRDVISRLSVYFTLKMGDMIVVELTRQGYILQQGHIVESCLNGTKQLTVRVK